MNDPGTCACGQPTQRVGVKYAMRLNAARQQKLRERALRRRELHRRRRAKLAGAEPGD